MEEKDNALMDGTLMRLLIPEMLRCLLLGFNPEINDTLFILYGCIFKYRHHKHRTHVYLLKRQLAR